MAENPGIPNDEYTRLEEQKRRLLEAAAAKEACDQQTGKRTAHRKPSAKVDRSVDQLTIDSIVPRLEKRFGLGDRPETRRKFYLRLVELVQKYGEIAYEAISTAAASAVNARQPGRYFCAAAKVMLLERGISIEPAVEKNAVW